MGEINYITLVNIFGDLRQQCILVQHILSTNIKIIISFVLLSTRTSNEMNTSCGRIMINLASNFNSIQAITRVCIKINSIFLIPNFSRIPRPPEHSINHRE